MAPRIATNVIRTTDPVHLNWAQWCRDLAAAAGRDLTASEVLDATVKVASRHQPAVVSQLGGKR